MSIVLSSSTYRVSISACSIAFNKVSTVYHLVLDRKREKLPPACSKVTCQHFSQSEKVAEGIEKVDYRRKPQISSAFSLLPPTFFFDRLSDSSAPTPKCSTAPKYRSSFYKR
jgi:hypothetical protein